MLDFSSYFEKHRLDRSTWIEDTKEQLVQEESRDVVGGRGYDILYPMS